MTRLKWLIARNHVIAFVSHEALGDIRTKHGFSLYNIQVFYIKYVGQVCCESLCTTGRTYQFLQNADKPQRSSDLHTTFWLGGLKGGDH
jgi:hypothetical protein